MANTNKILSNEEKLTRLNSRKQFLEKALNNPHDRGIQMSNRVEKYTKKLESITEQIDQLTESNDNTDEISEVTENA